MTTVPPLPTQTPDAPEDAPTVPTKYGYPEFAGSPGERYLKTLLRQILPMALYRTWEIFTDHQAVGNECYLGVSHLAKMAGRSTRTIERNLASLSAKHLLVERAARKVLRSPTGVIKRTVVIIKDFAGLYALAHEYHEWLNAEEYLAPKRELLALLSEAPHLVAKLRRFENYRKVLYQKLPGPAPRVRETDRWFSDYQAAPSVTQTVHEYTLGAKQLHTGVLPTKERTLPLAAYLTNRSGKRITRTKTRNRPEGVCFDSASPSSSKPLVMDGERTEPAERLSGTSAHALDERSSSRPEKDSRCVSTLVPLSRNEAYEAQGKRLESPDVSDAMCRTSLRQTRADGGHAPGGWPGSENQAAASSSLLARSFVHAIATPFGDHNPKGTQTRMLSLLKRAQQNQPAEVLACLIRAYVIARDTRTIRQEHCHRETGLANRMPLFCAMFQRLLDAGVQHRGGDAGWRQVQEALAADERLARWWQEHQHLVLFPCSPVSSEAGEEQHLPGSVGPGNLAETAPEDVGAAVHPLPGRHNGSVFAEASAGLPRRPVFVDPATNWTHQYEASIRALMARYRAPAAGQEVS